MADGHPRALAGSAEASVAVAEIRDATGKLILNSFKLSRQVLPSPTTKIPFIRDIFLCIILSFSTYKMAAATAPMKSNSGNNAFKVLQIRYI